MIAFALAVVAGLVAAQLLALVAAHPLPPLQLPRNSGAEGISVPGDTWRGQALLMVALGAFLFLQLQVFQNVARLSSLTQWGLPESLGYIAISDSLGLAAALLVLTYRGHAGWLPAVLLGIVLVLALSFPLSLQERQGLAAAPSLLVGQVCASALLMLILKPVGASRASQHTSLVLWLGWSGTVLLTTMALIFAYYVGFGIETHFDRRAYLAHQKRWSCRRSCWASSWCWP